jgi:hypothetical protein
LNIWTSHEGAQAVTLAGTYVRVLTGNGSEAMRPVAVDPANPSRIWGIGAAHGQVGLSDDYGDTFVAKTSNPSPYGIQGIYFSQTYAWLLTGGSGSIQGELWRSGLPDSNGNGLSWVKVTDLAALGGGVNSTFRNSCFAVCEPYLYLLEYGNVQVTGGPSLYESSDFGATWTKRKTWTNARHGHAVKVLAGVPWVSLGDIGASWSDVGIWCATSALATSWSRRTIFGDSSSGNYLDVINFFPMNVGDDSSDPTAYPMLMCESDGRQGHGPIVFPSQSPTASMALFPTCKLPLPTVGTMRQLTLTSEGNLMWVSTGEGGAVGPVDSVWISAPPFSEAFLLEKVPLGTFSTLPDPVECGPYIFFGRYRITKESFVGGIK